MVKLFEKIFGKKEEIIYVPTHDGESLEINMTEVLESAKAKTLEQYPDKEKRIDYVLENRGNILRGQ